MITTNPKLARRLVRIALAAAVLTVVSWYFFTFTSTLRVIYCKEFGLFVADSYCRTACYWALAFYVNAGCTVACVIARLFVRRR